MQLLLFFLASSQRNGSGTRGIELCAPGEVGCVASVISASIQYNTNKHHQQSPAIRNNQLSRPPAAGLNSSKGGNPVPASPHTVTGPTFQRANDLCRSGRCFSLPGTVAPPSRPVPCLTLVQRGTSCTCHTVRYLVCLNPVLRTALPYTVSGAAQARPWTPGPTPTNTITSGPGRLLLNHHNSTTLPTTTTTHNRRFHHHHHNHRRLVSLILLHNTPPSSRRSGGPTQPPLISILDSTAARPPQHLLNSCLLWSWLAKGRSPRRHLC